MDRLTPEQAYERLMASDDQNMQVRMVTPEGDVRYYATEPEMGCIGILLAEDEVAGEQVRDPLTMAAMIAHKEGGYQCPLCGAMT